MCSDTFVGPTQPYAARFWYFEVVEMLRKVIIAGVTLLVVPNTPLQIAFAMVVVAILTVAALKLSP